MSNTIRAVVSVLALMLGAITLPVSAAEKLQPAVMTADTIGETTSVIFKSKITDMKVEELAAVAVGAAVVGSFVDMFFESGIGTIIGVAAGAALGSHWYEEGMWPFSH